MKNLFKKIELLANLAIILVALMIGIVFVKRYVLTKSEAHDAPTQIALGTKISLPDTQWSASEQTLLLVLQKGCHFCSESAPFYQRLAQEVAGRVRLIAVLPQNIEESQRYLSEIGVKVDEVRQAPPSALGASGTPTLLLVDNQGAVTGSWIGRLPAEKEAEVLDRVRSSMRASR